MTGRPSWGPGTRFGPYVIVAPLATGGMATLWRARREGIRHPDVVLKVMLEALAESEICTAMFLREAAVSASLSHPCILPVQDVGRIDGRWFMEMPYLAGRNLRQILRRNLEARRPTPAAFALAAVSDLCDALAYVHDVPAGPSSRDRLVHRDVSPENVMVGLDGRARLLDFGVAELDRSAVDRSGLLQGKLHYMAPEVIRGEPSSPSRDVYAVGVTLYELLGGRRPFRGRSDVELVRAIEASAPSPLRELRPDVPSALDELVRAALARDPSLRPTADEVGVEVRNAFRVLEPTRSPGQVLAAGVADGGVLDASGSSGRARDGAELERDRITELATEDIEVIAPDEELRGLLAGRARGPAPWTPSARPPPPTVPAGPSPWRREPERAPLAAATSGRVSGGGEEPARAAEDGGVRLRAQARGGPSPSGPEETERATPRSGGLEALHRAFETPRRPASSGPAGDPFDMPSRVGPGPDRTLTSGWAFGPPPRREDAAPLPERAPPSRQDALYHFERGLEHRRRGHLEATLGEWELAAELDPSNRTIATNVRLMKSKLRR